MFAATHWPLVMEETRSIDETNLTIYEWAISHMHVYIHQSRCRRTEEPDQLKHVRPEIPKKGTSIRLGCVHVFIRDLAVLRSEYIPDLSDALNLWQKCNAMHIRIDRDRPFYCSVVTHLHELGLLKICIFFRSYCITVVPFSLDHGCTGAHQGNACMPYACTAVRMYTLAYVCGTAKPISWNSMELYGRYGGKCQETPGMSVHNAEVYATKSKPLTEKYTWNNFHRSAFNLERNFSQYSEE
jgi:hypothetical protein